MQHLHRPSQSKTPPTGPKPKLAMVQLPLYRVHYRRLEDYLAKVYHMEGFNFLRATGISPGMVPEYTVSPALPPAADAQQQADAIRAGKRTSAVGLILNVLCRDSYIPSGHYIIDTYPEPSYPEPSLLDQYRVLLQKTGTPESLECAAFRRAHQRDRNFTRCIAEIDTQVLMFLRQQRS